MQVPCPECDTRFDAAPATDVVCPACMASFTTPIATAAHPLALLPEDAPVPSESAAGSGLMAQMSARVWEVQTAEGGIIHGLSRYAVREGIYLGKLGNAAKVRRTDGTWEALGSVQEFATVFRLIGVDPVPAPATRKIAGWKGERVESEQQAEKAAPAAKTNGSKTFPILLVVLAGGGLLFLLLLVGLYLAFG